MSVIGEKKNINIFGVADTPTELTTGNYLTNDTAESLYLRKSSASNTYVSDAVYSSSSGAPLLSVTLAPNPSGSGRRVTISDTGIQQLQTTLSGKQDALQAITTNTPLLNGLKIRALSASQNVSLSVADDIVSITGPDLSTYAPKNAPIFQGLVTTSEVKCADLYLDNTGRGYTMASLISTLEGLVKRSGTLQSISAPIDFTGNVKLIGPTFSQRNVVTASTTLPASLVGAFVRIQGANYTVTLPSPIPHPGGRMIIHVTQGPITLSTPAGVFSVEGSGSSSLTLPGTLGPIVELISDQENWVTTTSAGSLRTSVDGKQNTITVTTTGTPLLVNNTLRSLQAGSNITLSEQNGVVTISGPAGNLALSTELSGKQDTLTAITTNTPIMRDRTIRALQAGTNIELGVANDIVTINANLSGYALTSDVNTNLASKQNTLIASAGGTPLLNSNVVRSLVAGTNVSLALQNNDISISVPYIAGNTLITTGATTLTTQIVYGGIVNVSGTSSYTITLPSPVVLRNSN